jgi:hypothetical protein
MPSLSGLSKAITSVSSSLTQAKSVVQSTQNFISSAIASGSKSLSSLTGQVAGLAKAGTAGAIGGAAAAYGVSEFDQFKTAPPVRLSPESIKQPVYAPALLEFPADRPAYHTLFIFKKYVKPAATTPSAVIENGVKVILPFPQSLEEAIDVTYQQIELGAAIGTLTNVGVGGQTPSMEGAGAELLKLGGTKIAENAGGFVGLGAEAKAAASIVAGAAINPHLAAIFQKVDFRTHTFTYKLSPNNQTESESIKTIIKTFKKLMLPIRSENQLLLNFPCVVDIHFIVKGKNRTTDFVYIKPNSVITNFRVNYGPTGLAFMKSGDPASVEISFNILETEIHVQQDYA